jgi:hypothetical protein
MFVYILGENNLFLNGNRGLKIKIELTGPFRAAGHLYAELLPSERFEIRSITP